MPDPGTSLIAANWGIAVGGFFLGVAGMFATIYHSKNGDKKKSDNPDSGNPGTENPESKYVLQGVCDARYNNLESRLTRIEKKLDEILQKM